eukprot:1930021-Pleurochrysis_carterae.AAC.3
MTPKKSDGQLSLEKDVAESISPSLTMFVSASKATLSVCLAQSLSLPSGMTSSVESRLKMLPSASVPSKSALLYELVGLELEALETLIPELGSSRRRRTGAATVATELEEANAINAVTWMTRLDSRRENRLAAAIFFATCSHPRQLWHNISSFSEVGRPDALYRAKRVALSCHIVIVGVVVVVLAAGCIHVHRVHAMATIRAFRWCLLTNHAVAKGVAPKFFKGIEGQRERRIAADRVRWAAKGQTFFMDTVLRSGTIARRCWYRWKNQTKGFSLSPKRSDELKHG